MIENKQKFISQIMTSKSPVRTCEDIDEATLSYAEVKALATGNPLIKEKMDLDIQVNKLQLLKANHKSQRYQMQDNIMKKYPQMVRSSKEKIALLEADVMQYQTCRSQTKTFTMKIGEVTYTDKKAAGEALLRECEKPGNLFSATQIGEYMGLPMFLFYCSDSRKIELTLRGKDTYRTELDKDVFGNLTRIHNTLEKIQISLEREKADLANIEQQLENAKREVEKPFPKQEELTEKLKRLGELNLLLNMDEKDSECEPEDPQKGEAASQQKEPSPRTMVALESTEDYSDAAIGFTDYHYLDGTIAHRYCLACVGEDGKLNRYPAMPEPFFRNQHLAQQFISEHADELTVIPYEEMLSHASEHSMAPTVPAAETDQPPPEDDFEF